ncbi:hypothetical protein KSS87_014697, partial [Heliosperma pusillum]
MKQGRLIIHTRSYCNNPKTKLSFKIEFIV